MPPLPHPYIVGHLKIGTPDAEIRYSLQEAGWNEDAINSGISLAKQSVQPVQSDPPKLNRLPSLPALQIQMPILWLLLIQIAIGLEWLVSALSKIISPNYPAEFSKQIATLSTNSPLSAVSSLLRDSILPSYTLFAYLLEYSELLIALIFLSAATLAIIKKGWEEEVRRILIPGIFGGLIISVFSLVTVGIPTSPPIAATAPDLFNVLVQVILLIAYSYLYFASENHGLTRG